MATVTGDLHKYEMTLYHCPLASSARVMWALCELGIDDVEIKEVNVREGEQHTEPFRTLNPMMQVPVMEFRERSTGEKVIMTEGAAIVQLLAERTGLLQPSVDNVLARAKYLRFCAFSAGSIQAYLVAIRMHKKRSEPHIASIAQEARKNFKEKVVPTLEGALKDGEHWICAPYYDHFTMADLLIGSALIIVSTSNLLDDSPVLCKYMKRVMDRKAVIDMFGDRHEFEAQLREFGIADKDWKFSF